jgi:hypothetical protein
MPAGFQHPAYVADESLRVVVQMRGFDIQHHVHAGIGQRQRLCVALLEAQVAHAGESLRGQRQILLADVDAEVTGGLIAAGHMRGAAAAAAAHFHHVPVAQHGVADQLAVQLQAVFLRLAAAGEFRAQRRETVVHEREILGGGGRGVVELPCLLAA